MKSNFIRFWGSFWSKMGSSLFLPQESEQITENLYAIKDGDVNLFIYSDRENTICIDAGYINNHNLKSEFEKLSIDPTTISHLFLTHTDLDHAGSIDKDSQANWFHNARVFMGKNEVCMIDGSTPRRFIFFNPVEINREYTLLEDGEVIKAGSITVQAIATPGHTPGHLSYLINDTVLCTGDALVLKDGLVDPFYKTWNMDHPACIQSVRKIASLENISVLCTAHTKSSREFDKAVKPWRSSL